MIREVNQSDNNQFNQLNNDSEKSETLANTILQSHSISLQKSAKHKLKSNMMNIGMSVGSRIC